MTNFCPIMEPAHMKNRSELSKIKLINFHNCKVQNFRTYLCTDCDLGLQGSLLSILESFTKNA